MSQPYKSLVELFADKSRWIQNDGAVDENGWDVKWDNAGACAWCLLSGIHKVYGLDCADVVVETAKSITKLFCDRVLDNAPGARVVEFNDSATYEEVVRVVTLTEDVLRIYGRVFLPGEADKR